MTKMWPGSDAEIVIAGGGLIGLAAALELNSRGRRVAVLESGMLLQQASTAAAGMLAAGDPHNPAALRDMAVWSANLWPEFLQRLNAMSGMEVRFQTEKTLQHMPDRTVAKLAERSVDPREVAGAMLLAVQAAGIAVRENVTWSAETVGGQVVIHAAGDELRPEYLVHATGAWLDLALGVRPVKGQMLRVVLPEALRDVRRNEQCYVVPRLYGPQKGTAIIGATVEDAGFDVTTQAADLARLRMLAAELLPSLADETKAPQVEAWAGLRPATRDGLPLLGFLRGGREYVASGHFRNGVLLAPATARIIADALEGKDAPVDLRAFSPGRFGT